MQKPNRASYTAAELLDWATTSALILTPKFQRRGVWQPAARSFFIDTILREMPVPPVYFRMAQSPLKDRVIREVIDGQQRMSAVIDFMRDKYALSGGVDTAWKGKRFSDLPIDARTRIRDYSFAAEVFPSMSDAEVLEVFSRLNTYSIRLNDQELRNGKYFGQFKQLVYELAYQHLEFWRVNNIFGERGIARMEEAQLVSELLIMALDGLQDKKKTIDSYYARYDESFSDRQAVSDRFRRTIGEIAESIHVPLRDTEFHRVPLFYTLFGATYHRLYGIPGVSLQRRQGELTDLERQRLDQAVISLSESIQSFADADDSEKPDDLFRFIEGSLRQTDNLRPRQARLTYLYRLAFG